MADKEKQEIKKEIEKLSASISQVIRDLDEVSD
jgi:hypothetical protein